MQIIKKDFLPISLRFYATIKLLKIGQIIKIVSLVYDNNQMRKNAFEGHCIAYKRCKLNSFITLKKNINGINVQNSYLINSPSIIHVKIVQNIKKSYKKAKLYSSQFKYKTFNKIKNKIK